VKFVADGRSWPAMPLQSVELALGSDQPPQELQDLHKSCALQLVAMTSTVRGRLTDLERQVGPVNLVPILQLTGNMLAEGLLPGCIYQYCWLPWHRQPHAGTDQTHTHNQGPKTVRQQLHRLGGPKYDNATRSRRQFCGLVHAQAVVALITADVHNRDVVLHLMEGQCHSAADFAWQRQLRYEYDGDVDTVVIRQVNAR